MCVLAAVTPLALVLLAMLGFFIWALLGVTDFGSLLDLFVSTLAWLGRMKVLLVALAVFAIGFGISGLLTVLASRYQSIGSKGRISKAGVWSWRGVTALVVVLGVAGVLIVLRARDARLDLFGHALLLGPILLTIFVLGPLLDWTEGHGQRGYKVFLWLIGLLIGATVAAFVLGWVRSLGDWVAGWLDDSQWAQAKATAIGHYLPDRREELPGAVANFVRAAVTIGNMVLLAGWLFWRHPEELASERRKRRKKRGFFGRLLHSVSRVLGRIMGDVASETAGPPPREWLHPLLNSDPLPDGCTSIRRLTDEERGVKGLECASPCEDSLYLPFFGGIVPSVDQHRALEMFLVGEEREFSRLVEEGEGATGDLMVCGRPGSGRHTWMSAAAVAAAVLRGDKVLVLSADAELADACAGMMREALQQSQVSGLILVQRLDQGLEARLDSGNFQAIPEVLVATPWEVQSAFFSEQGRVSKAKKAAIRMIDSIIVSDITSFHAADSLRLPFLIGKIRLVNEVARDQVQVVVLAPSDMDEHVRDMIGDRLISPIRSWRQDRVVAMRPWRAPPEVEVLVGVVDVDAASAAIASFLLEMGQFVVVVRRGLGSRALRQVHAELLPEHVPPSHLQVVPTLAALRSQVPEPPGDGAGPAHDWCVIMARSTQDEGVGCVSVPLIPNAEHTAIIHLGRRDDVDREPPIQLPLFGSSRSEGQLVRELADIIPYLELRAPVHRNVWRQFGVPGPGKLKEAVGGEQVLDSFQFLLDPPEAVAAGGHASSPANRLFPWLQLEAYEGHHLDIGHAVSQGATHALRLRPGSGSDLIVTSRALCESESGRIANWSIEDQVLRDPTLDLAATDVLEKTSRDGRNWRPRSVMSEGESVRIEGYRGSDSEDEAFRPMWSGEVSIPEDAIAIPATQGFPPGVRWYQLRQADARQLSAACAVAWQLTGFYSLSCASSPIQDVSFRYEAAASMLVLGTWSQEGEPVAGMQGQWCIQAVDGVRQYWPEMTAAIMAGLSKCVQHAGRLGRVMAFRDSTRPGVAQVVIVELPDLRGTLEELFRVIFRSEKLRGQFVAEARNVLIGAARAGNDRKACFQVMAVEARQAIGSFERTLDPRAALAIIEEIDPSSPLPLEAHPSPA